MVRVFIIITALVSVFLCCKSSKNAAKYISPHTDTIKIAVSYQPDTVELFVKRIIESDSLFNLREGALDYALTEAKQEDSILFVTVKSFNGCSKLDFDLYQSSLVFKTNPPRVRVRLRKTAEDDCADEQNGRVKFFTAAFDIRDILDEYKQAYLAFNNTNVYVLLKQ